MRTFFDLVSVAALVVGGLYFGHTFLAMHARLSEVRQSARAEATLRLFVKVRPQRAHGRGVSHPA
jgi:hypothetical protein